MPVDLLNSVYIQDPDLTIPPALQITTRESGFSLTYENGRQFGVIAACIPETMQLYACCMLVMSTRLSSVDATNDPKDCPKDHPC